MTCEDLGLLILLQLCQHIIQAGDDDPVTCFVLWGMLSPSHQKKYQTIFIMLECTKCLCCFHVVHIVGLFGGFFLYVHPLMALDLPSQRSR